MKREGVKAQQAKKAPCLLLSLLALCFLPKTKHVIHLIHFYFHIPHLTAYLKTNSALEHTELKTGVIST